MIARIIQRPVASGHLGEWLASEIFDVQLENSASAKAIDGRFRSGPLKGRTVDIKWYLTHQGLLSVSDSAEPGYYLVLTAAPSPAASSRGAIRPWCIHHVYLFNANRLRAEQRARGVRLGVASSVTNSQWAAAEIYPLSNNLELSLKPEQVGMLQLFRA
jgi:hypothetical protein